VVEGKFRGIEVSNEAESVTARSLL